MIMCTGDTHGSWSRFSSENWPEGRSLNKYDTLIIAGDFGLVWDNEPSDMEQYWTNWLHNKPWTTCFIDGNHSNHTRLNALPTVNKFGSIVGKVSNSIYHLKRGNVYTIEDKKFFCFGGAKSVDKEHRTEGVSWWPEEEPSFSECNHGIDELAKHNNTVDYIITHTAPSSIIKILDEGLASYYNLRNPYLPYPITTMGYQFSDTTSKYLEEIRKITKYKQWFFGHFHQEFAGTDFRLIYQDIIKLEE